MKKAFILMFVLLGLGGDPAVAQDANYSCRKDTDCVVTSLPSACDAAVPFCMNKKSAALPPPAPSESGDPDTLCGFEQVKGCQCVQHHCRGLRVHQKFLDIPTNE